MGLSSEVEERPEFVRDMLLIRRFEETVLELFELGELTGTTHTSLGQEACAVGVIKALGVDDVIVSNHRCHGHFIAYGGPIDRLFAEVMGRRDGVCQGIGGSQHLHYRNFYSNGVLGGTVATAIGIAAAEKQKVSGTIVTVFLGDGALGEGVVYESLNIAQLWRLPVLFVVEANGWAQSTPISDELAGDIRMRFEAFGIETQELAATEVGAVHEAATNSVGRVRAECRPRALILQTYRLGPHSKGDDDRPPHILDAARTRDPLNRALAALHPAKLRALDASIRAQVDQAVEWARLSSPLDYEDFVRTAVC